MSFVLGCCTAFLAGLGIAQTAGQVTAHSLAPSPAAEITAERGAGGKVVLRPTVSGKTFAALLDPGRVAEPGSRSRNEITFHEGSLSLELGERGTAWVYELQPVLVCRPGEPCQPCRLGICVVPPPPIVNPVVPRGVYQVQFLFPRP